MFIEKKHNQEINFENGSKLCVHEIITIEEGNFIHLLTEKGIEYIVNKDKVLFTMVIPIVK